MLGQPAFQPEPLVGDRPVQREAEPVGQPVDVVGDLRGDLGGQLGQHPVEVAGGVAADPAEFGALAPTAGEDREHRVAGHRGQQDAAGEQADHGAEGGGGADGRDHVLQHPERAAVTVGGAHHLR